MRFPFLSGTGKYRGREFAFSPRKETVMCRKLTFLILFVSTLAIGNRADAGVIMQCDVGGCGVLQSGWIEIGTCGTTGDVGGTGIDVTLATGEPAACDCRKPTEPDYYHCYLRSLESQIPIFHSAERYHQELNSPRSTAYSNRQHQSRLPARR